MELSNKTKMKWTIVCQLNFFITNLVCTSTSVTWEREPGIMRIGEPVTLTCTVHSEDTIDYNRTRQWLKGTESIAYNGHLDKPSEYNEILTSHNQFKLLVKNITESDFTSNYQCRYGFDTYTRKLKINADNFEYPPTVKTTNVIYNTSSNGRTSIHLHLAKVFPLPNCTLALENNYYQFRNTTIVTHSVYYEVFLNCEVTSCNIKPEIHCHLIEEYPIPWTMFLACKDNGIGKSNTILVASTCIPAVFICIVVIVIVVCYKRQKKYSRGSANCMLPQQPT